MISIFAAYKKGLEMAWKEKRMLFWLYGFNLLFAYLITMPVAMMISNALAKTTTADKVLTAFDFTTLVTIIDIYGKGINMGRMITTFGILYLIINIFFAGGILKIFIEEKKFSLKEFFSGCVEYFSRFLRLFLFSLMFIIIAIIFYLAISSLFSLFTENATTEHAPLLLFILKILITGIMLAIINMLFDYARIMTIVNDFYGMYKTIKQALMFVMMSVRQTVSLYFLYVITLIVILLIYLFVESFISVTGWLTILIFFLWTQLFVISRMWIRMSFFAGQYSFYHHSNTAMPGMTKEMMDKAVEDYEKRAGKQNAAETNTSFTS
jgi:hypothetical protein